MRLIRNISYKDCTRTNGTIVKIRGVPDMYDWEYFAQEVGCNRTRHEIARANLVQFLSFRSFHRCLRSSKPHKRKLCHCTLLCSYKHDIFYRGIKECNASLVVSAYAFEADSPEEFRAWMAECNQEVYVIGPLLPANYGKATDNSR